MAAQQGLDMLLKIDISGTLTTVGGLRSTSITMSDESVDITNKDSLGTSLDIIEGVGPKTVGLLISHFGSVKQVMEAKKEELITLIGKSKTEKILTAKK